MLRELLGSIGERTEIRAPFKCDYGYNIELGAGVFVNYDCVFPDTGRISIGDGTELGPTIRGIPVRAGNTTSSRARSRWGRMFGSGAEPSFVGG